MALYGSHSQFKNSLYVPNFIYFSSYFPNFNQIFSECEGKGSLKSQIKSLIGLDMQFFVVDKIEIIF